MAAQTARFDLILDTVSATHDISRYVRLLRMDGTLCVLGVPDEGRRVDPLSLLIGRKRLAGSGSVGNPGTRDTLDFCDEHGITANVEVLPRRPGEHRARATRAQRRPLPPGPGHGRQLTLKDA